MEPSLSEICERIAEATSMEEGPSGVEAILRRIHSDEPVSAKQVAKDLGLPIPLVSAVRRELEKTGWLVRKRGMALSDHGRSEADRFWGNRNPLKADIDPLEDMEPDAEDYIPLPLAGNETEDGDVPFLELLAEVLEERPAADRRLDQSHATLETVLRRAELFLDRGTVQGKRTLFLGDDDLTSLVVFLMVRRNLGEDALRSNTGVVVEVDTRLVGFIRETALSEDLPLAVVEADLREPLPEVLKGSFDFFFTDPPYTAQGVDLFLDRGCEALAEKGLRKAALAVPLSPPSLQFSTQRSIQSKGFVIDYLDPAFNEYQGATMQGGVSALYGLSLSQTGRFKGTRHLGRLYTAQRKSQRKKSRNR